MKFNQLTDFDYLKSGIKKYKNKGFRNFKRYVYKFSEATDNMSRLAGIVSFLYGNPSNKMNLIGITGTNGKTTTTYFVQQALTNLGVRAGIIGTIGVQIEEEHFKTELGLTTPMTIALNQYLNRMNSKRFDACAMEVSSVGIVEQRIRSQKFAVGVFTNLSHDHLIYHGTFEAYANAKEAFFKQLGPSSSAVVNRDDPYHKNMIRETSAKIYRYGKKKSATEKSAVKSESCIDINFEIEEHDFNGLKVKFDGISRRFNLLGEFNAYNLAAAYTTLLALGYEKRNSLDALVPVIPPPGRMQFVNFYGDSKSKTKEPIVIIDFAHTPDALEKVLDTLKRISDDKYRLTVVFGCHGGRDKKKRPMMARIAEKFADRIIVTSDNPRSESLDEIIRDIVTGFKEESSYIIEPDRECAIRKAILNSFEEEIIIIAGKGPGEFQEIGGNKIPFSDQKIAEKYLKKLVL